MSSTKTAPVRTNKSGVLAEELEARGWSVRNSRVRDASGLSQVVTLCPPLGSVPVRLMIVTYPGDAGQLVEFVCEPTRGTGKSSTGSGFYWRMSAFDVPTAAVLAAARVAMCDDHAPTFDSAVAGYEGWEVGLTRSATGQLESSAFVHPTAQVMATYYYPTAPGECGGWVISAPGCHVEATGHTPGAVIRELTESLVTR